MAFFFFFSSRRRHTRLQGDWSSDVCSSDLAAAVGLLAAGLLNGSFWALAGLSVATIGFYGMKTSFWPLPSNFLSGTAAAAAIAAINSVGNLGGLIGPNLVG